ncbi:MAG TPA: hypothetical protein VHJ78_01430 [Actinomycetota bacterium]|nr:hypothetical protein [Actinomycetota bacterium]
MRRHSFDAVSLVFGALFAAIGILYLSGREVGDLVARFWPAALVILGLAILFTARREDREAGMVPPAAPGTPAVPPRPGSSTESES